MQFKTVAFEPVVSLYTAALLCTQTEPKQTKKEKQKKKNMERKVIARSCVGGYEQTRWVHRLEKTHERSFLFSHK